MKIASMTASIASRRAGAAAVGGGSHRRSIKSMPGIIRGRDADNKARSGASGMHKLSAHFADPA
jgi:hypothetical protein